MGLDDWTSTEANDREEFGPFKFKPIGHKKALIDWCERSHLLEVLAVLGIKVNMLGKYRVGSEFEKAEITIL